MKQGIGYTVTINIMAIFIVVTFAFLVTTLNYYKAYKVNNVISDSIEKYEGYNDLAKSEISKNLSSIGYVRDKINCKSGNLNTETNGYCIYEEKLKNGKFRYKITTYLNMKIPIINNILNLPVNTYTDYIYYFSE